MKKIFFLSFLSLLLFGFVQNVKAAEICCVCQDQTLFRVQAQLDGCDAWCKTQNSSILLSSGQADNLQKYCKVAGTAGTTGSNSIPNPLGSGTTIESLIARIINYILGLVGTVSLLLFIYGGMTWMTSAGSSDKVKKGRDILVWAVIGMAVVFMSYIAVKFVIQGLQGTL